MKVFLVVMQNLINELINFINNFYKKHNIKLDSIYNAKMIFRIIDLINKTIGILEKIF